MQSDVVKGGIIPIVKCVLITLIVNIVGVLIFSLIVKLTSLGSGVIRPINQFIKMLAIFLGCFFSLREKHGLLKGTLVGVLGSGLTYLVFALISGKASLFSPFILDLLFGAIVGAISGILTVNVKKEK